MPRYFIQGYLPIDPASHPDDVMFALNRHGAELTTSSADRGGSHFRVGESVEAPTVEAALAGLKWRIEVAVEHRKQNDRVQRFAIGTLVTEYISEWLPDDAFGAPQLGPVLHLVRS